MEAMTSIERISNILKLKNLEWVNQRVRNEGFDKILKTLTVFTPLQPTYIKKRVANWLKEAKEWGKEGTNFRPTAYDILTCLTTYEPEENIDDFANEFGYTKISETIRVHKAMWEEWNNLKMLYSDEELELLREIS